MKKCVIFYFSGTGNTKWVADNVKESLDSRNIEAKAVSIESVSKADIISYIESSDIIGFGYPIYGSDLPEPMKRFIDNLQNSTIKISAFVFCTQMGFSGDGSFVYEKALKSKGFNVLQTAHINMPNNISISPYPFRILPPVKKAKVLKLAKAKSDNFAEFIISGKKHYNGKYGYLLGILQRGPYRAAYKSFQDLLSVDAEKCTKCGRCAPLCPVNNIRLIDELPSFNKQCAQCLRCYNFCPTMAIMYNGKLHNDKKQPYLGPDKSFKPEHLKRNS
jgi:flavodoxin/ferredoxin